MHPVDEARAARNPVPEPTALARTYRGDRDGWERVLDHWRVQRYCADHPDAGSTAVASELELPRSRIRTWVDDGGAPDPVHGLRTAFDRGWIVDDLDLDRRRALAVAVAWIFASGSISEPFAPRFAAQGADERERIDTALATLGVELDWIDRDEQGQGVEGVPATDASVLGRVLVAAGAPGSPEAELPEWITTAPAAVRRAVAAAYVATRGQPAGDAQILQIREETRTDGHRNALGELLVGVAGAGSFSVGSGNLRLDRDATDVLLEVIDVEI